jgi:HPt (histidine-containing phosphotransfer) domain-containing protein
MDYQEACRHINTGAAIGRLNNDNELYCDLLESLFEDKPVDFSSIELLIQNGDYGAGASSVHKLKGVSGTLGADRLYSLCAEVELFLKQGIPPSEEAIRETKAAYGTALEAFRVILAELKAGMQS